MSVRFTDTQYQIAKTKAGYSTVKSPGYLIVSGPDPIPFLQRQSTNDLRHLEKSLVIDTVLTSPTARVLDVLTVFKEPKAGEDPLLNVLTLPGRSARTEQYLKSRIFFIDQVQVRNVSQDYTQINIDGPLAAQMLHQAGVEASPGANEQIETWINGAAVRIIGRQGFAGYGYRILTPTNAAELLQRWLISHGFEVIPPALLDLLRIEAGKPGEAVEMTEEYTPLEINLNNFISDKKGCYTGQEVLARQVTYDKITRKLVGIKLMNSVPIGETVAADRKPVGKVTSAAVSPVFGPIALAVIKRPFFEAGTQVAIKASQGDALGIITELPFT
jgi:tRNA-modifying protein YgfZ